MTVGYTAFLLALSLVVVALSCTYYSLVVATD